MKKKICMIVQNKMVKGGIAAVISGYYGSALESDYDMIYVESYKDGGKIAKLLKAIWGYFRFVKVLLVDKPDLIHIHSSFGPSFYRKLPFIYMASWAKVPVINHIHGADFNAFYVNASEKKRLQIRKVYGKCARLIALSEEWKERLAQIVPAEKITVIENYSIVHEDALEERLKRKSNQTVLFLGEIGRRKGCYDIPAVAAEVIKALPNAKFVLAGTGSPEDEQAVRTLVDQKKIGKNVAFPGWIRGEEKDRFLREADVFFLPSYNEGMPMSILDAMGYGLPIVSTNVGGIPKIVHDGENGVCCAAGKTMEMSKAIVAILSNYNLWRSYSKNSLMIVKKQYSLESHLDKLKKVYDKVGGV